MRLDVGVIWKHTENVEKGHTLPNITGHYVCLCFQLRSHGGIRPIRYRDPRSQRRSRARRQWVWRDWGRCLRRRLLKHSQGCSTPSLAHSDTRHPDRSSLAWCGVYPVFFERVQLLKNLHNKLSSVYYASVSQSLWRWTHLEFCMSWKCGSRTTPRPQFSVSVTCRGVF